LDSIIDVDEQTNHGEQDEGERERVVEHDAPGSTS